MDLMSAILMVAVAMSMVTLSLAVFELIRQVRRGDRLELRNAAQAQTIAGLMRRLEIFPKGEAPEPHCGDQAFCKVQPIADENCGSGRRLRACNDPRWCTDNGRCWLNWKAEQPSDKPR